MFGIFAVPCTQSSILPEQRNQRADFKEYETKKSFLFVVILTLLSSTLQRQADPYAVEFVMDDQSFPRESTLEYLGRCHITDQIWR